MTISLALILLHFIGDWLLQSDSMGINKSKSWKWLLYHTSVYSLCFLPFYGVAFVLITFITHTVTDAITSRITTKLWFIDFKPVEVDFKKDPHWNWPLYARVNKNRHWFFVVIGADQLCHYITLAWTYRLLVR